MAGQQSVGRDQKLVVWSYYNRILNDYSTVVSRKYAPPPPPPGILAQSPAEVFLSHA